MTDSKNVWHGFASMSPERRREISAKGGKNVPDAKRSFSKDPDLAAAAGRKGGIVTPPETRSFSTNRELAAEAGRKGGLQTQANRAQDDKVANKKIPPNDRRD